MLQSIIHSSTPKKVDSTFLAKVLEKDKTDIILNQTKSILYPCGEDYDSFVQSSLEENIPLKEILQDLGRYSYVFDEHSFFKHPSPGHAAPAIVPLLPETQEIGGLKLWDIRSFIGNSKDHSSLHFDWNTCPILLMNFEGTKKIDLYPPSESIHLQGYYNFSAKTPHTSEWQFEIGPYEAIVIPPYWWHKVHYETKAKSISFRFFPDHSNLYLIQTLYPSWKFLQLASHAPENRYDFESLLKKELSGLEYEEEIFQKTEEILNREINFKGEDHVFYKKFAINYLKFYITKRPLS